MKPPKKMQEELLRRKINQSRFKLEPDYFFKPGSSGTGMPAFKISSDGLLLKPEKPKFKPKRRMRGLIFARPDSTVAKNEIVPRLDYYHRRSGDNITFYCAGYQELPPNSNQNIIATVDGKNWAFSNDAFCRSVAAVEQDTTWQYSGGTEILLVNTHLLTIPYCNDTLDMVDMSTAVICQLDIMLKDEAIESVEIFLETIFRYAESCDNEDPTWGFSTEIMKRKATGGILAVILSLLPEAITKNMNKVKHFIAWDITKSTQPPA
jgi:hypothetical protein